MQFSRFALFGLALALVPVSAQAVPEANSCVSGKLACTSKTAGALLKCYGNAQKKGEAVDADCLTKAQSKFTDCFAGIEAKQDPLKPSTMCRTSGDAAVLAAAIDELALDGGCSADQASCPIDTCAHSPCATGAALAECNDCVARICDTSGLKDCCSASWDAQCVAAVESLCGVDCDSYQVPPSKCTAGKTSCAAKRLRAVLGCFSKAQKKGVAVDPGCLDKAQAKFDGGDDPADGCFAKLEAKQDPAKPASFCPVVPGDDAKAVGYTNYAAEQLACTLEDDNCECCNGQCFEFADSVSPPVFDPATGLVCGDATLATTVFSPPCASCGGSCPLGQTCVNGECKYRIGERRCQPVDWRPECVPLHQCNYIRTLQSDPDGPWGPGVPLENTSYTFIDVEGYQDRPVYFHVKFDSLFPGEDYTAYVYAHGPGGVFKLLRSNHLPGFLCSPLCWDGDGAILSDLSVIDTKLSLNSRITDNNTGLFEDGPLNSFVSSQFASEGYILKFAPDIGWTGDTHIDLVIQRHAVGQPVVPIVSYRVRIRPETPPPAVDIPSTIVEGPQPGHYYGVMHTPKTWGDALYEAATKTYNGLQGHLVTIDDAAENAFVHQLAQNYDESFYIGLADPVTEGTYTWYGTGEAASYFNWAGGEPNNGNGGNEDFTTLSHIDGLWNDTDGTVPQAYVVEFE